MKSNFDGFKPHFKYLVITGCYKMMYKPTSKMKETLHTYYRITVSVIFAIFLLQHIIRLIQIRHDVEEVINTLYVFLTLINSACKVLTFNIRSARIENIVEVIKGPVFSARSKYQEELVERNAATMLRVLRMNLCVSMSCSVLWMLFPLMIRLSGQQVRFSMYYPFETDRLSVFISVVIYVALIVHWVSLYTLSIDCIIISLYMQAQLQLQILRDNLTHLADEDDDDDHNQTVEMYRDVKSTRFNSLFYRRLIMCKKRHELIDWLVAEIEATFGTPMVLQILVMAWIICMTIYKIASLDILSVEFLAMIVYLSCILFQLFIYCYFGTQLKDEIRSRLFYNTMELATSSSEFVNQSIYESNWPIVSPRLRLPLLIMMERCYRPIAPCIAYVVPMSLDTFISVLKFSYSLYTFLDRK